MSELFSNQDSHLKLGSSLPTSPSPDARVIPLLVRSTFTRRAGPITVRNFRIGPVLSLGICRRGGHGSDKCRSRTPLVFAFCKPVEEFDPRPVRNNIGD